MGEEDKDWIRNEGRGQGWGNKGDEDKDGMEKRVEIWEEN